MSPWSKFAYDNGSDELIVVDLAAAVGVEEAEEALVVLGGDLHSEVVEGLLELVEVEGLGVVVVHDLEDAFDAVDAPGAPRNDLVAHALEQLHVVHRLVVVRGLVVLSVFLVGGHVCLAAHVSRFVQLFPVSHSRCPHVVHDFSFFVLHLSLGVHVLRVVLHGRVVQLAEEALVHVHLPVLLGVLPVDVGVPARDADGRGLLVRVDDVHVPDANDE